MNIRPFLLERYFAKYEFNAPYLLCSSDCETMSIEDLLNLDGKKEENLSNLLNLRLGYTESKGDPELRNLIASLYDKIKDDNILTFSGAAEGIFLFMNAILNKNDNVISIFPSYQSLYEVPLSLKANLTLWELKEKNGWYLDLNLLKKLIKKNTRLLIINFPHNPTGFCPVEEQYKEIINICDKNGIYLFSDEVYRFLEYDIDYDSINKDFSIRERKPLQSACDLYERAFSLGVMSKSFGLAGLRIGWIASQNKNILDKIATLKDYTTICSSAPSEFLSKIALKKKDTILKNTKNIIFQNLKILLKFFEKYKIYFNFSFPSGGSIAFPYYYKDTDILAKNLIETKGVLLMPSSMFEYGKNHFRLGFGRKNMPQALKLFDQFCEENLVK
ncbi:MAG: aminotransferase class I/II-fold pyridoxal phosphate-dependent enzyme [Exilispira sp.]